MDKICMQAWRKCLFRILAVTASFLMFTGCQRQETLPRSEFPLSESDLAAALEETGLDWSIEQRDELTDGKTMAFTYTLRTPEMREGYNGVSINTYDSEEHGRRLHIFFSEPQNKQWWLEEDDAGWEEWKPVLMLIARIYGGFTDAEEIYRSCSAQEMPKDTHLLWEGMLTGGYFRMMTNKPMRPERLKLGNTLTFNMYESKDAYLKTLQEAGS